MSWPSPRDWTDGERVLGRYLNDIRDGLDYLRGALAGQTEIELTSGVTYVPQGIGAQAVDGELRIRHRFPSGNGSPIVLKAARSGSAPIDNQRCDLVFAVGNTAGTVERLAELRFIRSSATNGDIGLYLYDAGSMISTPAMFLDHREQAGVNTATPGFTFDIVGDINATSYDGLSVWNESPANTLYHAGNADIIGQWISTVATGTAPFIFGSNKLIRRLNADTLKGESWVSATLTDSGSESIATAGTDYTVATVTIAKTGYHIVIAEASVTVATNDTSGIFRGSLTGGAGTARAKSGTVGQQVQLCCFALASYTATDTVNFIVSKTAGAGSSTAAGSMIAQWVGV